MTTVSSALLDPLMAADPAGPRITYYDDATGERIELSTVTLANWAAKTGNLLRDELGAGPASRVAVLLPAHWQTAAVLFGIWWIGAEVVLTGTGERRHRAVHRRPAGRGRRCRRCRRDRGAVAGPVRQAGARPACRRHRLRDIGAGARRPDLARAPSRAPHWTAGRSTDVLAARTGFRRAHRVSRARPRAVLERPWDTADELIDNLLAVFAAGASLVQVANPDAGLLDRRRQTEKVTRD